MALEQSRTFGKEPHGEGIGPFKPRGAATGLIIYKGYIIASWGEPSRVDMTHSITKSFLSAVVGEAVESGIIRDVHDKVSDYVQVVEILDAEASNTRLIFPFASDHNRSITWNDMLRQTSDWEGTLWGKPEWADRPDSSNDNWKNRPRYASGSRFEYNDVRVNALALAATAVYRQALPVILKEQIMDPIGASSTWHWTGYHQSFIVLNGSVTQSVSGGGHWGGGMFINAFDMGRYGLLTMHKGKWKDQQLISEEWIRQSLTPTSVKNDYGYMNWFLNTGKKMLPAAPETAFMHQGNGANLIYADPEHELVIVARWIESKKMNDVVHKVLAAYDK